MDVIINKRDGTQVTVRTTPGFTLMETIRDAGDLLALCGGMCSCATCHVYVESNNPNALPPMSEDENELLQGLNFRKQNSRLSCQITLSDAQHGLSVTIAPEE